MSPVFLHVLLLFVVLLVPVFLVLYCSSNEILMEIVWYVDLVNTKQKGTFSGMGKFLSCFGMID